MEACGCRPGTGRVALMLHLLKCAKIYNCTGLAARRAQTLQFSADNVCEQRMPPKLSPGSCVRRGGAGRPTVCGFRKHAVAEPTYDAFSRQSALLLVLHTHSSSVRAGDGRRLAASHVASAPAPEEGVDVTRGGPLMGSAVDVTRGGGAIGTRGGGERATHDGSRAAAGASALCLYVQCVYY